MRSQDRHDHHIFQQKCHTGQTQASSMDLIQSGFDPQANYWPEQQPLKIHHSSAARCLCTIIIHLAGLLHPNLSGHIGPRTAASRPSECSSTLITSLISPGPDSNSSTSKMDVETKPTKYLHQPLPLPAHRRIHYKNKITHIIRI